MLNQYPQPGMNLQETQNPILTNFTTIDTGFSVNHVQFNDGSGNQGKHNLVDFVQQSGDIAPGATEINIYNKAVGSPAINELFLFKGSLASSYPITQLAKGTTTGTGSDRGWTCLPSGLVMKWAQGTTGGTTATINMNTYPAVDPLMPTITNVFFALIMPRSTSPFYYTVTAIVGASVSFTTSASNVNYTIIAWGM